MLNHLSALAAGAATVSSDALMNPFDGELGFLSIILHRQLGRAAWLTADRSHQTTDAVATLPIPDGHILR